MSTNNDNPYSTPAVEVESPAVAPMKVEQEFFGVSRLKFTVMFFATMGLYSLVWFHQNWRLRESETAGPVLRTIFAPLFAHGLFRMVRDRAREKQIETEWNPTRAAALFVGGILAFIALAGFAVLMDAGPQSYLPLLLIPVLWRPLYRVQDTANQINGDPAGRVNDSLTSVNWVFLMLGLTFQLLNIAGALIYALSV